MADGQPVQSGTSSSGRRAPAEVFLLLLLFFVYAGDAAPMVNEAHYLVKAKNFWDASWCQNDLFTASGKAHTTFYTLFGWPTKFFSLSTTAWLGRLVGWLLLAVGLQRLCSRLIAVPYAVLAVAIVWIIGIERGNLAGEWVIGGIEAKVPAYGFVLMAMAEMCDRNWNRVWPLLGVASAFHVLSGGWSVVAALIAWWAVERKRSDRRMYFNKWFFLGGAIALLGLVPALQLSMGANATDSAEAAKVYSYFRIKHHLLPADFKVHWYIRHGILLSMTLSLGFWLSAKERNRPWSLMLWFCVGTIVIAGAGLVVGLLPPYAPDLAAKLLRYYWFRLTDAVAPLTLSLVAVYLALELKDRNAAKLAGLMIVVVCAVLFCVSAYQRICLSVPPSASNQLLGWDADATKEQQLDAFDDWLAVCQWARESTPADEIFLTPRHQQTFKWYAHRAEVVNWKDVPQDAESLKEWKRRFDDVFPKRLGTIRTTIKYSDLRRYQTEYNVRFMIVDRRVTGPQLPLVRVYPVDEEKNDTYAVFELPR